MSSHFFLQPLELVVEVNSAKNLDLTQLATSSVSASVYLDGHVLGSTAAVNRSTNPVWRASFKTSITHTRGSVMYIKVFNGTSTIGYAVVLLDKHYPTPVSALGTDGDHWHPLLDGAGSINFNICINAFPDVPVMHPTNAKRGLWWQTLRTYAYDACSITAEDRKVSEILEGLKYFNHSSAFSLQDEVFKDMGSAAAALSTNDIAPRIVRLAARRHSYEPSQDISTNSSSWSMWIVSRRKTDAPLFTRLQFSACTDYLRVIMGLVHNRVPVICKGSPNYELYSSALPLAAQNNIALNTCLVLHKESLNIEISDCTVEKSAANTDVIPLIDVSCVEIDSLPGLNMQILQSQSEDCRMVTLNANVFSFRPPPLGTLMHFKLSRQNIMVAAEEYRMVVLISDHTGTKRFYSYGFSSPRDSSTSSDEEHYFHAMWQSVLSVAASSGNIYGGCKVVLLCEVIVNGATLSIHNIAEQFVSFQNLISSNKLLEQPEVGLHSRLIADVVLRNEQRVIYVTCGDLIKSINSTEFKGGVGMTAGNYMCSFAYQLISGNYKSDVVHILESSTGDEDVDNNRNFSIKIVEPNDLPLASHVRLLFIARNFFDLDGEEQFEMGYSDISIGDAPNSAEMEHRITIHWNLAVPALSLDILQRLIDFKFYVHLSTDLTNHTAIPVSFLTDVVSSNGGDGEVSSSQLFWDTDNTVDTDIDAVEDPFSDSVSDILFTGDSNMPSSNASQRASSSKQNKKSKILNFGVLRLIYEVTRSTLRTDSLHALVCAPSTHSAAGLVSPVHLQEIKRYATTTSALDTASKRPMIIQSMKLPNSGLLERSCKADLGGDSVTLCFSNKDEYKGLQLGKLMDFVVVSCDDGVSLTYLEVYEVVTVLDHNSGLTSVAEESWLVNKTTSRQYPVCNLRNDHNLMELSSIYSFQSEWILAPDFLSDEENIHVNRSKIFVNANEGSCTVSTRLVGHNSDAAKSVFQASSSIGKWQYAATMRDLSDPLLRCSGKLPGCRYKRRRWIRYLEKYALPMAIFSDLHESIRDIMPKTQPFSGPFEYSPYHKPHKKIVLEKRLLKEEAELKGFVPPFLSHVHKARFGSLKERSNSTGVSFIRAPSMRSMSFKALDASYIDDTEHTKSSIPSPMFVDLIAVTEAVPICTQDPDLVTQTHFNNFVSDSKHSTVLSEHSVAIPMHCACDFRVVAPTVLFVALRISLDKFSEISRIWHSLISAEEAEFEYPAMCEEKSEADENNILNTCVIEIYVTCDEAFSLFRYLAMITETHKARAALSDIVPALRSFKNRVSDRDRMNLMMLSHAEMEKDRKAIWNYLSMLRADIRLVFRHSTQKQNFPVSKLSSHSFDLHRFICNVQNMAATAFDSCSRELAEIVISPDVVLDVVPALVVSLLIAYHTLVVTHALDDPEPGRVLEICLAEESSINNVVEMNSVNDDMRMPSRGNSGKIIPAFSEDSDHNNNNKTLSVDLSIQYDCTKFPSALDASSKQSVASKRSAVRYSHTPNVPSLAAGSSSATTAASDKLTIEESNCVTAPELFTKYQKMIPGSASRTVNDVVAFASFLLDETETRIILCSRLPRSGVDDAQFDASISELCIIMNMLITRCIRQLVLVAAEHVRRAAVEPQANYLPAGISSALSFLDSAEEMSSVLISASVNHRLTSISSMISTERELSSRYKPNYLGFRSQEAYLPLCSYFMRANGRLSLIANSMLINNDIEINRSALLTFFMDMKSLLKWELRPRVEAVYDWCLNFCNVDLFKYLEVKMLLGACVEERDFDKTANSGNILSAPEEFAFMLHNFLFDGAYELFLHDLSCRKSIFAPQNEDDPEKIAMTGKFPRSELLKNEDFPLRFSKASILSRHQNLHSGKLFNTNERNEASPAIMMTGQILVDTQSLRKISFLNDLRQVCCRGLDIIYKHYADALATFSWSSIDSYLNIVIKPGHMQQPARSETNLKRDFILFCGLANDCIDFSILTEECSEAICRTMTTSKSANKDQCSVSRSPISERYNLNNNLATTASALGPDTAELQHRGRVVSMKRAELDYGVKLATTADSFARLAATAVHALCKELVKSAESASTAHNGSVDCRFSSVADILSCVDFLVKDIGNFLMNGLFLFFLKLLLEQITELIFKFVALDMDGDEYFYLEHVSDIGNATAFKNSKKKLLTEIGAIRLFFFQACESRNWSEDFIYIASGADRSRLNLDLNQFASASVSSPVKTNKRIDVDPLGQVVPSSERINSRSGPDSKQRSYSRSDMSNLSAQLEHIRVNNHMVQNPMMSQASFESNVATIHEQWRFIKEIHPELGSLLYTLEKRLEIDNRYGETGANDDLPSVCDIGTVIKSVTKIDIADSAMDLHSIMSLPSYRSALDRKFYGVPRGNAPDISLKVSEIALLLFKYKSYTLSHSGSVNMNAELWCLNRGRMVYRAVTKTATNDKYPCWKDVLQYTYSSDASGGIIDELVIILCDHQEGNLRNTFKDIPLCYARVSVSAIDICLNVRESVQLHPILLSEDEWMKCITNQVLPNEIKRKTRSIFSRRSATSSQRHSAGSMQSSVSESEIGELRISFSGWISRK